MHGRVLLQREELRHADAAGPADARQVVAQQVHDHHVLGAVLLALGELAAQGLVVHRPEAPRPGALDRPGLDLPAVEGQEALGRHAEHGHVVAGEIGAERRGVLVPQPRVERERRLGHRGLEPLRQVRLEDVAGQDVLAHALHRAQVAAPGEGGAQPDRLRPLEGQHGIGWGGCRGGTRGGGEWESPRRRR